MKKNKRITRIIAMLMAAITVFLLLPLSVSAASANCNHNYGGVKWADAVHPHEYFYHCENGCGSKYYIPVSLWTCCRSSKRSMTSSSSPSEAPAFTGAVTSDISYRSPLPNTRRSCSATQVVDNIIGLSMKQLDRGG